METCVRVSDHIYIIRIVYISLISRLQLSKNYIYFIVCIYITNLWSDIIRRMVDINVISMINHHIRHNIWYIRQICVTIHTYVYISSYTKHMEIKYAQVHIQLVRMWCQTWHEPTIYNCANISVVHSRLRPCTYSWLDIPFCLHHNLECIHIHTHTHTHTHTHIDIHLN